MRKPLALLALLLSTPLRLSAAETLTALPGSRHQQFLTYGLFTEEQTGLVMRDANRAWAGVGASMALAELSSWAWKPQLVLYGVANVSFLNKGGVANFGVETLDTRLGLAVEMTITPRLRLSVGLQHISGQAADGVQNQSLIGPNLSDDAFVARLIYDVGTTLRVGGTLKPILDSDPPSQSLGFDQFLEWFPLGVHEGERAGTWFLAGGLDESGRQLALTWNVQAGIYFGSHWGAEHRASLRMVVGYYDGWDPRLKYAQLLFSKVNFPYAGVNLNF